MDARHVPDHWQPEPHKNKPMVSPVTTAPPHQPLSSLRQQTTLGKAEFGYLGSNGDGDNRRRSSADAWGCSSNAIIVPYFGNIDAFMTLMQY